MRESYRSSTSTWSCTLWATLRKQSSVSPRRGLKRMAWHPAKVPRRPLIMCARSRWKSLKNVLHETHERHMLAGSTSTKLPHHKHSIFLLMQMMFKATSLLSTTCEKEEWNLCEPAMKFFTSFMKYTYGQQSEQSEQDTNTAHAYQSAATTKSKVRPGMAAWWRLQCNACVLTLVSPKTPELAEMFVLMSNSLGQRIAEARRADYSWLINKDQRTTKFPFRFETTEMLYRSCVK